MSGFQSQGKICPKCKALSALDATKCACGHAFRTHFTAPTLPPNQTIMAPAPPQSQHQPAPQAPYPHASQNIPAGAPAMGAPVPQYGYQPRLTFGGWLVGWGRYYLVRFGIPVLIVLGCIWGYGRITQAIAHTVIGQWEVVDSPHDMILVMKRDGTGWEYSGAMAGSAATDSDMTWTAADGKLTLRFQDNSTPKIVGYALSDDGQQMTIRSEGVLVHYHRLEGEPPPRPGHVNSSQEG